MPMNYTSTTLDNISFALKSFAKTSSGVFGSVKAKTNANAEAEAGAEAGTAAEAAPEVEAAGGAGVGAAAAPGAAAKAACNFSLSDDIDFALPLTHSHQFVEILDCILVE